MKSLTYLTFCLLSLWTATLFAQTADLTAYIFSVKSDAYVSLAKPVGSATVVDTFDPGTRVVVPIGFPFGFGGQMFTELVMRPQGEFTFGDPQQTPGEALTVVVFGANLVDKAQDSSGVNSQMRYRVDGIMGSRILKLEWSRMGFYWGSATDEMSAQIWLHEQTGKISMHYGKFQIEDSADVFDVSVGWPIAGLYHVDWNTEEANGLYLSGDGNAPTLIPYAGYQAEHHLTSAPDSGTVYQFCLNGLCDLQATSTSSIHQPQLLLHAYPNPATDRVSIDLPDSASPTGTLRVLDLTGRVMHEAQVSGQSTLTLSVSQWPAGLYHLQWETANQPYRSTLRVR